MTGANLRPHVAEIARQLLGEPNKTLSTRQQLRFGTNGSLAVEIAGPKCGQWYDHEDQVGGGPWELLTVKGGMTNGAAVKWLQSELGIEIERAIRTSRRIVATYDYRDAESRLRYQAVRLEPKKFFQRRPDGAGGFIDDVVGVEPLPYRLPELLASPDSVVFIPEGEKDVDNLRNQLGLTASCNHGGAGKWRAKISRWFSGRDVVILPDNDKPGREHGPDTARKLAQHAARVRILELPGLPPKGDVSDWLAAGGTREELERLAADASVFSLDGAEAAADQGNTIDDGAEIARLAALPPVAYGRERKGAAARLGCPVSILDRAVAAEGRKGDANPGQGRPLDLPEPEPWPEAVAGAELLDELAAAIRRHIVLHPHEADAVALWLTGVHAFDAWTIFPRLLVIAPEKQCGKTTLLDVLSRLVPKPLGASSITPASLFRTIEAARPTLLLDEADTYARNNEDLRSVLDAGHRRDGAVIRTVGDNHEPRQFSTFAPVALAAIGHLPGTVEDRSIIVRLRRRRPDEPVESLRLDRAGALDALARKAARWAADHREALAAADPAMPAGTYNRAADNWRPLLAVADLAGGEWPERARRSVAALSRDREDSESARVLLLGDIRAAFAVMRTDRMSGDDLAAYLVALDERPWSDWKGGKPITKAQVARQLKGFGISSGTIRLAGGRTPKGYYLSSFSDAFARYLPAENATTPQPQDFCGPQANLKTPHAFGCGVSEKPCTPNVSAACGVVAVSEPSSNDDDLILFEERAAIREYDGGLSRAEAERLARAEIGSGWPQ